MLKWLFVVVFFGGAAFYYYYNMTQSSSNMICPHMPKIKKDLLFIPNCSYYSEGNYFRKKEKNHSVLEFVICKD